MKWIVRFTFTACLSLLIAFAISYIPNMQSKNDQGKITSVFSFDHMIQLSDDNIVDFMEKLSLRQSIERVDWNDNALYIDLSSAAAAADNPPELSGLLHDLQQTASSALTETSNVQQVLVRIIEQPDGGDGQGELLIAMNARRGEIAAADLQQLGEAAEISDELAAKFHLSVSRKLQPKSGNGL